MKIEIALLLNTQCDGGLHIFNAFDFENEGDEKQYDVVLEKFD